MGELFIQGWVINHTSRIGQRATSGQADQERTSVEQTNPGKGIQAAAVEASSMARVRAASAHGMTTSDAQTCLRPGPTWKSPE